MDDFDEVYMERQRMFQIGLNKGIEQAEAYELQDVKKEGEQFGQQFAKQLAMYQSFSSAFYKLKLNEQPKNQKYLQLIVEIDKVMSQIDYKSLETVKGQRQALQKKFQLLMTMMGIKKTIQRELFQIKKEKSSLDF